jgi:lysine N6-hydroxylase
MDYRAENIPTNSKSVYSNMIISNKVAEFYTQDFLETQPTRYRILPNREVYIMERNQSAFHLYMRNGFNNENEDNLADVVVFATGYHYSLPPCLTNLKTRMDLDDDGLPK